MNWQQVREKWPAVQQQIKEKWGKLNDRDLLAIGGRRSELIRRVRQRYGQTKDLIAKEVEAFVKKLD